MKHSDIAALMKGIAPAIRDLVDAATRPLVDQITVLQGEITELRSADYAATVADLVADAVGKLPPAAPGKDADPELIAELVAKAVAELPPPAAGKGADPEQVKTLVAETVAAAVAELPPAEPGKSVTVDELAPLLAELVDAAVTKIPAAEPGKSVDPVEVEQLLSSLVDKAVAALPTAQPGLPGPPGKLPAVKAWEDRVYYESECCSIDGSTYQASKDTGRSPPHEDWTCIAAAGRPGADARQPEVKGTYDPDGKYGALNIVALNGAAFISRTEDPGPCPGEGWQVIAMRGKPGPPGEARKGERGKSIKGDAGSPVVAASVDDQGILTLVNGDGTTVECDFYPLLSKLGR